MQLFIIACISNHKRRDSHRKLYIALYQLQEGKLNLYQKFSFCFSVHQKHPVQRQCNFQILAAEDLQNGNAHKPAQAPQLLTICYEILQCYHRLCWGSMSCHFSSVSNGRRRTHGFLVHNFRKNTLKNQFPDSIVYQYLRRRRIFFICLQCQRQLSKKICIKTSHLLVCTSRMFHRCYLHSCQRCCTLWRDPHIDHFHISTIHLDMHRWDLIKCYMYKLLPNGVNVLSMHIQYIFKIITCTCNTLL